MMGIVIAGAATLAMLACLLAIPFGLPGLWLMATVVLLLKLLGQLSWSFALVAVGAVVAAEVGEFLVLKRFGERYGGSRRAFWGAVLGGMVGLFVGVPVPVVGSVVTAFLGTFLGAGLVTFFETRSLERSARVGWGVLLARTAAVALKVGVGAVLVGATAVRLVM